MQDNEWMDIGVSKSSILINKSRVQSLLTECAHKLCEFTCTRPLLLRLGTPKPRLSCWSSVPYNDSTFQFSFSQNFAVIAL